MADQRLAQRGNVALPFESARAMESEMRLGRGFWMLAALWAAIIFTLSSIPGRSFPAMAVFNYDKVLHATVYAVLGGMCYLAARGTWAIRPVRLVVGCTLVAIVYGLTDEFHQRFVPGRSSDIHDVMADGVGGLVGSLVAALFVKLSGRWPRPSAL